MEFVSPEGLRLDGRRARDLRQIKSALGVFSGCDGSASVEHGNTKVVAVVYGPHESSQGQAQHDRATLRCEYSAATFSTVERKFKAKGDRKSTELEILLARTFSEAVMCDLYPRSEIDIFVQVLQADGGEGVAVINAATLALIDAGVAMKDFVVACSVGCVDGTNILDVNKIESGAHGPELSVAILPKSKRIITTVMESRVHLDQFDQLLEMAVCGCDTVYTALREAVLLRTEVLASKSALEHNM
eukprot:m.67603 g.67603  ORF g.67603 m.67603 type:complete len:245 (-) comp15972_c0_seq18:2721-3455(-)